LHTEGNRLQRRLIQAVTGMSKPMIELYTRHMEREALAFAAVELWEKSGR
jgi:hypothetical protein